MLEILGTFSVDQYLKTLIYSYSPTFGVGSQLEVILPSLFPNYQFIQETFDIHQKNLEGDHYWHLVGRGQGAKHLTMPRTAPQQELSVPKLNMQRLRNSIMKKKGSCYSLHIAVSMLVEW